jgi:5-methylcytosine-specific restriction endonuclease McrA
VDNEAGYLNWIATNPDAFVANAHRNTTARYLITHQASCQTIRANKNFTTGYYIKFCGPDIPSILEFIENDTDIENPPIRFCSFCLKYHPTEDDRELELMTRARRTEPFPTVPTGILKPETHYVSSLRHERDPEVRAWVLQNAKGRCECCNNEAPFLDKDGNGFLEVHHVKKLSDDGSDRVCNAVALCPNCHRAFHHAYDLVDRVERLIASIDRLRKE